MPPNKNARRVGVAALVLGAFYCCWLFIPRKIIDLHPLTYDGELNSLTPEGVKQLKQEKALWNQRRQRDISKQLLPFLNKRDDEVRLFAIHALAELENPLADTAHSSSPFRAERENALYNLSLSRIRTRSIEGQERLENLNRSMRIPWQVLVEKSVFINGERKDYPRNAIVRVNSFGNDSHDTMEGLVIEEVVGILYVMARQGKNINGLATNLNRGYAVGGSAHAG